MVLFTVSSNLPIELAPRLLADNPELDLDYADAILTRERGVLSLVSVRIASLSARPPATLRLSTRMTLRDGRAITRRWHAPLRRRLRAAFVVDSLPRYVNTCAQP